MSKGTEELAKILGYDPTKSGPVEGALQKAVAKMEEAKAKEAEKKAEELLGKAVVLAEQMKQARSKFEKEMQKSEKELSKVVSGIKRLSGDNSGQEESTEEES